MKSVSLVTIALLRPGLLPKAEVHILRGLHLEPRGALDLVEPQTLTFPLKVLRAPSPGSR